MPVREASDYLQSLKHHFTQAAVPISSLAWLKRPNGYWSTVHGTTGPRCAARELRCGSGKNRGAKPQTNGSRQRRTYDLWVWMVHAQSIAVAELGGEARSLEVIAYAGP